MQEANLGIGVAATRCPAPPLFQRQNIGVMPGHVVVEAPYGEALSAEPAARSRSPACYQPVAIAADLSQGADAGKDVTTTFQCFPRRAIPFPVAYRIEHGVVGEPLSPTAEDDGDLGMAANVIFRKGHPAGMEQAIPVEELYVLQMRRMLQELHEPCVPGPGGRERSRGVKMDYTHIVTVSDGKAAVGGAGIDVDGGRYELAKGPQAVGKTAALIAADDHDSDIWRDGNGSPDSDLRPIYTCHNLSWRLVMRQSSATLATEADRGIGIGGAAMVLACVVGFSTGLLFKPLSLIPVLAGYCFLRFALPVFGDGIEAPSFTNLAIDIVLINVAYLAGALLLRLFSSR